MQWPKYVSLLALVTAEYNNSWPPTDDAFINDIPWPVAQVTPKLFNVFSTVQKGCSVSMMDGFESVLGMTSGSLTLGLSSLLQTTPEDITAKLEKARLAAVEKTKSLPANVRGLQQGVLASLFIAQDFLASIPLNSTFLESNVNQIDDTHVQISEALTGILNLDLDSIDDLLTGFITSRLSGEILSGLSSNSLRGKGWIVPGWTHLSTMKNMGDVLCGSTDVSGLLDKNPRKYLQGLLSIIVSAIGCQNSPAPTCTETSPVKLNLTERCEKVKLNDKGVYELPLTPGVNVSGVDDPIVQEEGPTYLALWSVCEWTSRWAANAQCNFPPTSKEIIPGWEVVQDFWVIEDGSTPATHPKQRGVPISALAKRTDGVCEVLMANRGTWTDWEWQLDVTSQLDPSPHSPSEYLHRGYLTVSSAILPVLQDVVKTKIFTGNCNEANTRFIITGVSMGGGMTFLWANRLSHLYPKSRVDAVAFAPAHSLSDTAMQWVRDHVNARSFISGLDIVPKIPCHNKGGLTRTPGRISAGIDGVGYDAPYSDLVNVIKLTPELLASLDPYRSWFYDDNELIELNYSVLKMLNATINLPSPLQMEMNHMCSYPCFLSASFCTSDPTKYHSCDMNTKICPEEDNCPNPAPLFPDPEKPNCPPYAKDQRSGATRKCNNPISDLPCSLMLV